MKAYEVWCHSCNVTFPPEQRRCLHCGGRLRPERPGRRLREAGQGELVIPPMGFDQSFPMSEARPGAGGSSEASVEEEPVRRSLIRAGMTVLWMVLLAAGYAWRSCSQQ